MVYYMSVLWNWEKPFWIMYTCVYSLDISFTPGDVMAANGQREECGLWTGRRSLWGNCVGRIDEMGFGSRLRPASQPASQPSNGRVAGPKPY